MLKIIQVKETLEDGKIQDNIYDIEAITKKIIKKLEATFSEEQQKQFEYCWELYNQMLKEIDEQLFIFGS